MCPFPLRASANNRSSNVVETDCHTSQSFVEEIAKLILIVNVEWTGRMRESQALLSRCQSILPNTLFERGFVSIQRCFQGELPQGFEDTFALIHVACAISYFLHKDDKGHPRLALFRDFFRWQYVIQEGIDRCFFRQALECLAIPQSHDMSGRCSTMDAILNELDPPLHEAASWDTAAYNDPSAVGQGMPSSESPANAPSQHRLRTKENILVALRYGTIMEDASMFLDRELS